jgi:hypothetical protein
MKVQKSLFLSYFFIEYKEAEEQQRRQRQESLEEEEEVKRGIFPSSKNTTKRSCMIYVPM